MPRAFLIVLIFISVSFAGYSFVIGQETIPEPPTTPMFPSNGAASIELNSDFTLTLQWNPVEGAEEYYCQYWKEGAENSEVINTNVNAIFLDSQTLEPVLELDEEYSWEKYFWRVKSCADINGVGGIDPEIECGDYSSVWSFTYTLPPPSRSSFSPISGANNILLPVDLGWENITGAKSYELLAVPCPYWLEKEGEECFKLPVLSTEIPQFIDDTCFFTTYTYYYWQVASCLDEETAFCGQPSELSNFRTNGGSKDLSPPLLQEPLFNSEEPEKIPVVSKNDSLYWDTEDCVYGFKIIIKKDGALVTEILTDQSGQSYSFEDINALWNQSSDLDQIYTWQVFSCWYEGGGSCAIPGSDIWQFKTAGSPPNLLEPVNNSFVKIPVTLSWEQAKGAESYFYQVASNHAFPKPKIIKEDDVKTLSAEIDYPELEPENQYWWRVKTCVDSNGKVCGEWSEAHSFYTYPINSPTSLRPESGLLPIHLSWDPDPGSNFYQYRLDYISAEYGIDPDGEILEESLEGCAEKAGQVIMPLTIVAAANITLYESCLGQYRWWVRSCLEKTCNDDKEISPPIVSAWANPAGQVFTATETPAPPEKGILPCGRRSDHPDTPYNEREACQIKHLGFLLQNILDFLLWRLGLIILTILSIVSAAISYFSLGNPTIIAQVKAIWKSAAIGYGIIFLAWIFINLLLVMVGFDVEFFGQWWQLPF